MVVSCFASLQCGAIVRNGMADKFMRAGDHHADTCVILLHSLLPKLAGVALCHWSVCRLYAAVTACQAYITVSVFTKLNG